MREDTSFVHRFGSTSLVDQITFAGLERTKIHTILREFDGFEYFDSIQDVYEALEEVHRALMSLDAFEAVDIVIDESYQNNEKISISVTASELGMLGINAGTYVQGSEGTVEATINVRNYLGYAEKMSLSVEQGMSNSNLYSLRLQIPRIMRMPYHIDLRAHQMFDNKTKWSSYTERLRGMSVSLVSDDGTRSCSYDCGWRTLSDPTREASSEIVRHLGESIKSSASLSFASTAFDDIPHLSSSTLYNIEIGGIGTHGIFQFVKGSLSSRVEYAISDRITLALEGTLGAIMPSKSVKSSEISPCDRFYIGGVGIYGLRGFHEHGVGPMSPRRLNTFSSGDHRRFDSLGGTFIVSVLGALRFPLPIPSLSALGIEGQMFGNAGILGDLGERTMRITSLRKFLNDNVRVTIGVGLFWPLQIGQLEANICRVINKGRHDYAKNGIQFGITPY